MASEDMADGSVVETVVEGKDGPARYAEGNVHTLMEECLEYYVCAGLLGHGGASGVWVSVGVQKTLPEGRARDAHAGLGGVCVRE
jgi:hypothetical protein